ncbi:MAG: hypothetical protein C5B60_02370 [Chloroflexi bacterium]|nr:MAG: hypothetical protein C5B60_02370 [Chloroflexota bacterium]
MPQVSTTHCRVAVVAPNGTEIVLTSPFAATGLLRVETDKDLSQAVGGFTLMLDGLRAPDGRTWAHRIPRRSLVFIAMDRPGTPDLSVRDATVMIGLTEQHSIQESMSEAQESRLVQVHGREIASVLLDVTLLYHPHLAENPSYGTLTLQSKSLEDRQMTSLIANPLLIAQGDPRTILQIILERYLFYGGKPPAETSTISRDTDATPLPQHPLISLDMPGLTLADILVPQYDAWKMFQPAWIPYGQFPAQVGSLYNYLHLFIDRAFQEFFTRIEDGVSAIHFRGKPFKHKYVDRDNPGTRFKSNETEPTLQTLRLDPADILTHQRQLDTNQIYNFFVVLPRGFADSSINKHFIYDVMPQVVTDHTHPSFVGRYGLRVMRVQSPYLDGRLYGHVPQQEAPVTGQPLTPQPVAAGTWAAKANTYATQAGIIAAERPWFVAMIHAESSFDPNARHTNTNKSEDQGIAQFNNRTAPTTVGLVNPFDPDNALQAAARYWQQIRAQVGPDPRLIVAGYNAGPQAVLMAKGVPPASAKHVARVASYVPRYQGMSGAPDPAPVATGQQGASESSPIVPASAIPDLIKTAQWWGSILRAWYDTGGELWSGTLTVRGHPVWNIGHRLLTSDSVGEWEAYIEGIRHTYDGRTGQYLTHIRYTRGWYLDKAITQQMWDEGQTGVTDATGGPPVIDPETGEVVTTPQA